MKLRQFIFALVAMLSFSLSAFAQTTVSSEDALKEALNGGGEVTLGASITVSSPVTISSGNVVVLNLNGKTLKATNAKTEVLTNEGKLTINGQGTVSGIIYNGKANGSAAEMILNGGTYSLDGNSGGLHHYGKTLTINDGVVVKTTSYGVRVAGKKSVLNLYGGTFSALTAGDMCRPFAITYGTVNFLDKDITVNGYMHVMVNQVTINFGENNENSPFEAYHQGNSAGSSAFYCKTLTEAISRTAFANVTLVKNVKVADGAPLTVKKEINLNLNGKNISAPDAKTTVLKNYAKMAIKGKGTVTGIVYNGDADNKGVAEMTLNGGTYKLDGANGGFFNYGKTLTVNDGVTISSKSYGLRMSNKASVINLNGGTFTSTNSYANMQRAIQVDAGTLNFNDDDITINGYVHANRSNATLNFGENNEFCPFDALVSKSTNASVVYYKQLENAIELAEAGNKIILQKNLERSEIVTLPKKLTLDGNGKTLTSTAGRAINVDCANAVTIENLTIAGATGCERGINIINQAGTTNIKKVNVSGVSHYAVHVATSAGAAMVNIENSNLTGWVAVATYGEGGAINVKNSNLVGINDMTDNNSNDFATIAAASNITVSVTGGKVTAERKEGKAPQAIVCGNSTPTSGTKFVLDTELELINAEYVNHELSLDVNTVTVREVYGTNFVTTPAGNGLVNLTSASEAMIGDVKYATLAQAFAAAGDSATITLISDAAPALTSQRAITKAAVIDLNDNTLTLNEDDLYFGTTTFKNGTIVVAPSVNASTAVFWMFKNQALVFDNVHIVATGVTGTYLIGIDGGTGTTIDIINGSSITIDNATKANLTAVICDNGTGNAVTIKDSEIKVKNIEGRFYLGGKNGVAVVENTNVDLNGVKEGFYLRAGQSLNIAGTSTVDIVLNSTDGRYGINLTDVNAVYTKAESATVNATVHEVVAAAKIGNFKYTTLQAAIKAVKNGETIYLVNNLNENVTVSQVEGVSFIIDGQGNEFDGIIILDGNSRNPAAETLTIQNVNFVTSSKDRYFVDANDASADNRYSHNVTIKNCNFTAVEGSVAVHNAVAARFRQAFNIKIEGGVCTNLHSVLQAYGCIGIEVTGVKTVNSKSGVSFGTSTNAVLKNVDFDAIAYGVRADAEANTTLTIENAKINAFIPVVVRKATHNYNVVLNGQNTFNATNNDNLWCAIGTSEYETNGSMPTAATGKVRVTLNDANLSEEGVYGAYVPVAMIGDVEYTTLDAAFKAATSGCTINIVHDVTVDYYWDARNTGAKFTVPVTINGNGKTIKFTNTVYDGGNYMSAFRFEADATVNNLVVDMSAAQSGFAGRFRAISSKGNLTVEGCTFIGNGSENNTRAIIFGEGAGANAANLVISIANNTFIGWKRGITDNENGQDVKTVTITDNTLTDAGVAVSAKDVVTFTGNKVEGAYVNIKSYTANNKLKVTATGNELEDNVDNDKNGNIIDAGGDVNADDKFFVVAKGSITPAFTGEKSIWGEGGGNAKQSLVVKLYSGETLLASASLNNIGGIINGKVYVSWNIPLNNAGSDEYWAVEWTNPITASTMPTKVVMVIDGAEVAENNFQLNSPDDLNKIYAAATDADGKFISCHTSLAKAVAANAQNIVLLRNTEETIMLPYGVTLDKNGFTANNVTTPEALVNGVGYATLAEAMTVAKAGDVVTVLEGTYTMPSMKAGITIEGEGDVVFEGTLSGTLENLTMKNIHIKGANAQRWAYAKGNLKFENVTFEATSVYALHFDGISEGTTLTYTNCTIIGWAAMGGSPASCEFKGCTFKGNGTYGVIRTYFDATIDSCTFDVANVNTNDNYQDGIHAVDGAVVTVTNTENSNGDMKALVNVTGSSVVTVDGKVYKNVAKIGDTKYITIEDAIIAWTNNTTLTLLADVTLLDVVKINSNESRTLDLGTFTMTAAKNQDAFQYVVKGCTSDVGLSIKADATNPGSINAPGKAIIRHTKPLSGAPSKDRPYTQFFGGVFNASYIVYQGGTFGAGYTGASAPRFVFHGGEFNGTIYANRSKFIFNGGTFNGNINISVDSSADALVKGGKFKHLSNSFGSELNPDKFTIGSSAGTYDREVYVDNDGYYVVAEAEPTEGIEADVAKTPGTNDYLAYSKVATEGQLGYTNVETALNNNTTATVTVYADEIDMSGINFKGTIKVPAGESVTITNAPADLKVETVDGYFLNISEDGTYTSMLAVAMVGNNEFNKEFESVQKALQYAIDNSAAEVVILTDVREKMETDFDLVIKANLTIKAADKFTAENPAKVEFYNDGTSMDFAVGTANGAERCTLTIADNVHFDLTDRVIWIGYYGNNVDVVVNGYLGGYQIWHGANTTVNGMLDSHGEAFIMRRDATLTANEGAKVNANYFNIYSGHINATGAEITAGLVWVNGAHNYGDEGNVSFTLNNTTFTSNGEVKMTVGEGKNIPVTVSNDSHFAAKGTMTLDNDVDVTVDATSSITHNNGQPYKLPVATINGLKYTSLQAAVDAVKNGETIVLVDVVTENVTLTEKVDLYYTIDGADKTMNGKITIKPLSDTNDNRRITIKGINFVNTADDAVDFISCAVTNHYPRLTIEGCTFKGNGKDTDVAIRLKTAYGAVIKDCKGEGLHSFLQNTAGLNLTIENVTVTESKGGFALGTVQGVTVQNCNITVSEEGYGIRLDANTYNNNAVIAGNKVSAFIPVVVRELTANGNITIGEGNEFTAANTDGKWMVIGKEEYDTNGVLPAEVEGANVVVALNDANLSYTGIHGAGLAGKGTEAEPYLINNATELQMLRDKVNGGATKFNAPGVYIALNANIDMTGINWVGIGTATADHGFMSNFDGKGYKFMNLNIDNPALDSDGYAYAGLFGVTEGTNKDNQNVIKNLIIENVTINTTGHIVSAAIAYPYYTIVDSVKVCGNIDIKGGDYTSGALAYTRRCVNASNIAVVGNQGSSITGKQVVGGVISDIQMNGGLKAEYSNFSAEGVTVTGEKNVGGISGIIAKQTLNGATVNNVALNSEDGSAGIVVGALGGTSTISDVKAENVTGATAIVGVTYDTRMAIEARIGDTYYATFAAAYEAAQVGETVTMLVDLTIAESLAINKSIAIDGNGRTLTYTGSGASARAITVENTAEGIELAISNLTVNCTASYCQRGINYNTNGKLSLDNVTVKGTNVTYALNLPGSADNAEVTIVNSNLTGNIALNVWGENSIVNVENSTLTSVDNSTSEGYATVKLNNDGATSAEGTVITITGGKIDVTGTACADTEAASNATSTGVINISETTVVNGEVAVMVAVIRYNNGYSYSFKTLEAAIAKANAGETVTMLRDVTVAQPVAINKAITLDGAGKSITYTGSNRAIDVANIADADIDVTIKNLTINNTASYTERGINYNENGTLTLENVIVNGEHTTYAINLPGMSQNANVVIKDSKFTGLIALNIWGANTQVTAENSEFYSVDHSTAEGYAAIKLNSNGSTAANNSTIVINGGKVIAKDENDAPSTAVEDCTSGSTVTISETTEVVGSTTKSVAIISYGSQFYTFSTIEDAIEVAKAGETIELINDVTISYGARQLLATAAADKNVTIDGKGHTLTLNSTNNQWSSIGLANNNKLVLKNMTVNKAGQGATSGSWDKHAIIFSTPVEMENVTVNNSVAVAADAAFTNVDFKEANGYYSLWIEANGQTVTINGGSMTATNGGRGIKIADEYINDAKKVVLNVDGTVFNTAKKAAVQVSSKAGADITAANFNIENVVADNVNFVWVDENYATYYGNVTVNGASVVLENAAAYVAAITVEGAVKAYYKTVKEAIAAVQEGECVALVADVTATEVILIGKSVTINGNDHKVTSNATRVFRVTTSNTKVTLNNVNMVNTAVRVGSNDIRGISIDASLQNVALTLNNCSVDFTDPSACDWSYAVNVSGNGTGHIVTVDGGTYEGANVINAHGANNKVIVKDATLTSLYPNHDEYYGACIWVLQNEGSSVEATGNTFNGDNAIAFNLGTGTELTESANIDNTKMVVAKIGNAYYTSIQDAVEAAQTGDIIKLIQNVTYDDNDVFEGTKGKTMIEISGKNITLDLNGKTINASYTGPNYLMSVIHVTDGAGLTVTGNGFINVNGLNAEGAAAKNIAYVFYKSGETGYLNIENGTFHMNDAADSMVYTNGDEIVTINGGTFILDAVASQTNGFPVIFSTAGNNERNIIVNGGTFNYDINHQIRPFEPYVAPEKAVKANGDGTWTIVEAEAYVTEMLGNTVYEAGEWPHKVGYATLAEAIAAVNELGNNVTMVKDVELTETITIAADKTIVFDLNGKTVSMNDASGASAALIKNNGNLTITDATEAKSGKLSFKTTTPSTANAYASNTISNYGVITIEAGNVENLSVGGACYALDNYAGSTATINGGKLTAEKTAVRIFNWTDGEAAKATINMNGGEIYSKDGYGININSGNTPFVELNIAGGTISTDDTDYNLAVYVVNKGNAENFTANVTGGTFNGNFALNGVTATTMAVDKVSVSGGDFDGVICYDVPAYGFVSGGTFKSEVDAKYVAISYICKANGDGTYSVIEDPGYGAVAQIGNSEDYFANKYYTTINAAAADAVTGETITLIADVAMSAEGYITISDDYAVMVAVKEKDITIDLNSKTVTVTPNADELETAKDKMLMSVFGVDTNGKLTLTGEGTVKVNANGANVYSLAAAYGEGALLTIESGNYEADAVNASGSLIYSQQTEEGEGVIVNGGNFKLGNEGTGANGSPWIFNTKGQNATGVTVTGGTFNADINHQFWAHEVFVPDTLAVMKDTTVDDTWTIVPAVAYTSEKATSRYSDWRHVGYATIEEAIAATGIYNCKDNKVTMVKDVEIEPITIATEVVLNLNGKTITGIDNATGSYGLININPNAELTINGEGAIKLTATNNREWNAFSSVISNQRGKLTVNGGTIEHLGGTDMAYAIDNLTNGKGTYAETVINGGTVKSTYRAVRQFLNGVEAQNILTVNGGTLEGKNKAIFFHDASANANSGTLYVGEAAELKGDVYLFVTAGSTEWLVDVEIAKAALKDSSAVTAKNVPEGYSVTEYPTYWTVEALYIDKLTIVDGEYTEYINMVEKTVGKLTYTRTYTGEWETLYLPFAVPFANLKDQFEVAYIYNASYKEDSIYVDQVALGETDANFVLAANYPYLIKAKEAVEIDIVVEEAKLVPTEVKSIDCSSVFEQFQFIGNYNTLDVENLEEANGYFDLNGVWTRMYELNPFRVYMQITLRNGEDFVYPEAPVRMRRVDENGNVEIEDLNAIENETEQKEDMIFDLNGRRISQPVKGFIYIINGQKVLY